MNTDLCNETAMQLIIGVVKFVLKVIQFGIPILLIVLISIDLFKAMSKGDEKEQKAAQSKAIKRLIYAVVIFLVPILIDLVFSLIPTIFQSDDLDTTEANNFFVCWKSYNPKETKDCKVNDNSIGKMTEDGCTKKGGIWG